MEIVKILFSMIAGLMVLSYGAHLLVGSASKLARIWGISPLVIGLTIVSFGTSAPEFAVNVMAAYQGKVDIAMGNVVGSNIFNVAVIIGLCASISPLIISQQLLKLDIPIMVVAAALTLVMGQDGAIGFYEALLLFTLFLTYTIVQLKLAKNEKKEIQDEYDEAFGKAGKKLPEFIKLTVGLTLLIVGAKIFVDGAVWGARLLGISEAIIALTIISVGTSLPEVATSVTATLKGENDIAVGNVVGSNIFNIFGVLGLSGLFATGTLLVDPHIQQIDIPLMLILAGVCAPLSFWRQRFDRWIGPLFLITYILYVWHLLSATKV